MKRHIILAASAVVALSSLGHAADLPSRRAPPIYIPPPLPVFTWTGFYIGATAGAAVQSSGFITTIDPGTHLGLPANLSAVAASGTSIGGRTKVGAEAGGEVGYNYQINSIVLGIEGDVEYVGGGNRALAGAGLFTTGDTFAINSSVRQDFLATLRGRVGFAVDRALFFATGGAAFTDRRLTQTYADTLLATTGALSATGPTVGFAVGGGIEYALTNNWSVKAEYLYTHFGTARGDYTITSTAATTNNIHVSAGSESLHVARVGVNYRFDTTVPVVARY